MFCGVWGLVHLESLCIYYYLHIWTYEFKYLVLRCSFVFGRSGIAPCEVLPPCEMMSSVGENYRNCKWDEVVTSLETGNTLPLLLCPELGTANVVLGTLMTLDGG